MLIWFCDCMFMYMWVSVSLSHQCSALRFILLLYQIWKSIFSYANRIKRKTIIMMMMIIEEKRKQTWAAAVAAAAASPTILIKILEGLRCLWWAIVWCYSWSKLRRNCVVVMWPKPKKSSHCIQTRHIDCVSNTFFFFFFFLKSQMTDHWKWMCTPDKINNNKTTRHAFSVCLLTCLPACLM